MRWTLGPTATSWNSGSKQRLVSRRSALINVAGQQ
jgi:hypothetical protein